MTHEHSHDRCKVLNIDRDYNLICATLALEHEQLVSVRVNLSGYGTASVEVLALNSEGWLTGEQADIDSATLADSLAAMGLPTVSRIEPSDSGGWSIWYPLKKPAPSAGPSM